MTSEKRKQQKRESVRRAYYKDVEKTRARKRQYYHDNVESQRERQKQYYAENTEKCREATKEWFKSHPDYNKGKMREYRKQGKMKKYEQRKHEKMVALFGKSCTRNLDLWGHYVKRRDTKCQICGTVENLNAHHIFYKLQYPGLAFNDNNGIALCKPCHDQTHGRMISHYV